MVGRQKCMSQNNSKVGDPLVGEAVRPLPFKFTQGY